MSTRAWRVGEARRTKTMPIGENFRFATRLLSTGVRLLHYAERGDPTGEAIVFFHGCSDSWYSFSRALPLLSPEYHAFALTSKTGSE